MREIRWQHTLSRVLASDPPYLAVGPDQVRTISGCFTGLPNSYYLSSIRAGRATKDAFRVM